MVDSPKTFESMTPTRSKRLELSQMFSDHLNHRSYAGAMQALQDKIKNLENENKYLREKSGFMEAYIEDEKIRLQREFSPLRDQSIGKSESKELIGEMKSLKEQLRRKDSQISFLETYIDRLEQQKRIDKENFELKIRCINKQIEEKEGIKISNLEHQKNLLMQKKVKDKKLLKNMKSEVDLLKETSALKNKHFKHTYKKLEQDYLKMQSGFVPKIRKLKEKNALLTQTNKTLTQELDSLKHLIKRTTQSTPIRKNCSVHLEKNDIQREITRNESELSKLNTKYKSLVSLLKDNTIDHGTNKKKIMIVSEQIDKTAKILFSLKKSQQNTLKRKLCA